jgi:predicted CoA-binding protein
MAMSDNRAVTNPSDDVIKSVLTGMKSVAVVGISAKPDRASHGIARFLQGQGFQVYGVNPLLAGQEVLGLTVVAELSDLPPAVDVVNVFRRSDTVPPVVDAAIAAGAGTVWMQEDVVHEEAAAKARSAGLNVVQDRCIYKEWLRLMNG